MATKNGEVPPLPLATEILSATGERGATHFVRSVSLFGAVALGAGLVIGVGLFTVATNAVGYLGPALIGGNVLALVVSVLTSLCYAELAAAWPYAGGSYVYAYESWGKAGPFVAFMAAWLVIEAFFFVGAEALAFANYFLSTLDFYGIWHGMANGEIPFMWAAIIATVLILIFTVLNHLGIKEVDRVQKALMISMWAAMFISVFWVLIQSGDMSNYHHIPKGLNLGTFMSAATLIWWAYAGQEVVGTMGEEIKHPTINLPRALLLVPVIVFAVTVSMQWLVVGIIPDVTKLQDAGAPFALALSLAGVGGVAFGLLMFAEFMGNFSTVNPVLAGASRSWFAMSRDGYLPFFGRLSKRHKTPWVAIWFNTVLVIVLLATQGLNWVASVSAFSFLALYLLMACTVIAMRITRPEKTRPFKVPLFPIPPLLVIGFCIWMMTSLGKSVIIGGCLWLGFAAVVFVVWNLTPWGKRAKHEVGFFRGEDTMPPEPTPEERRELNRSFRRTLIIMGAIVVAVCALMGITYALG
jgi:amino acid transporter